MASYMFGRFGVSQFMRGNPFAVKIDPAVCRSVAASCGANFLGKIDGDAPIAPRGQELLLAYKDGDPGLAFAIAPDRPMEEQVATLEQLLNDQNVGSWKVSPDLHYLLVRFDGMTLLSRGSDDPGEEGRPVLVLATDPENGDLLRFAFPSQIHAGGFVAWVRHPIFARTGRWFQMTFMTLPRTSCVNEARA